MVYYLVTFFDGSQAVMSADELEALIEVSSWLVASYTVYGAPPPPPPVYTCPYCGAQFASQAELNYHISTVHPTPGEYYGSIIKKELEYDSARDIIPVANVLQGKIGLFHVTARNDMSTSQPIGIYWFINDPDGLIAEEYTDWKSGPLGSGQTHEFIGGRFTFSKVGKYGTWVDLLMGSQSNPVVIYSARYIGELCTVTAVVPEPQFSNFGISDYSKV